MADWYLSTNLKIKKFRSTSFFKFKNRGSSKSFENSIFQFSYNRIDQLKKIINENKDIGTIKMEVARNENQTSSFLKKLEK